MRQLKSASGYCFILCCQNSIFAACSLSDLPKQSTAHPDSISVSTELETKQIIFCSPNKMRYSQWYQIYHHCAPAILFSAFVGYPIMEEETIALPSEVVYTTTYFWNDDPTSKSLITAPYDPIVDMGPAAWLKSTRSAEVSETGKAMFAIFSAVLSCRS